MRPQKRITRSTVFALLLASCALLLLRASPVALAASSPLCSPQAFALYPGANPSTTSFNSLNAIAASASNDVWAVGSYGDDTTGAVQTLAEHYTGSAWSVVASPSPAAYANGLSGISLLSATNIWAVGYQQSGFSDPSTSLVEHWDGASWSVIPSANDPTTGSSTTLYAVSAISASDVWAVGFSAPTAGPTAPFIEHWDGSSWSIVPGADLGSQGGDLAGIAAVSSTDVWAVGQAEDTQTFALTPLVEHWDGSAWSVVSTPSIDSGVLYAVTALSSTNVWAVGEFAGLPETLIEHWDGTAWSVVPSPNVNAGTFVNQLLDIAADSASDIWAVGGYSDSTSASSFTLVLHWNGTAWSIVPSANENTQPGSNPDDSLQGVVALAPTQVWAVGSTSPQVAVGETVVEHAIKNPTRLMCPR
jgi:hypothetical protein